MPTKRVITVIAALFVAIVIGACGTPTHSGVGDAPLTGWSTPDTPTPEATTEAPAPTILEARNLKLTLKVISRTCYGDQGCNYDVKVHAVNDGPPLSDEDTWEVTYQLTGDEGGLIIGTLEVTGNVYTVPEHGVSTNRNSVRPKVKVTGVEKVGI